MNSTCVSHAFLDKTRLYHNRLPVHVILRPRISSGGFAITTTPSRDAVRETDLVVGSLQLQHAIPAAKVEPRPAVREQRAGPLLRAAVAGRLAGPPRRAVRRRPGLRAALRRRDLVADELSEGGEMGEAGGHDGHGRLNGGPDEDRAHHPSDVLGLGEPLQVPDADGASNTNTAGRSGQHNDCSYHRSW